MVRSTLHPTLLDPATGLRLASIGCRRDGTPIWPMLGAEDGDGKPAGDGKPSGGDGKPDGKPGDGGKPAGDGKPDGKPDEPLGETGLRALQAERDARQKAERELQAEKDARAREKLTDEQRKDADRDAAIKRAETAESVALRYQIAASEGLSLDAAEFLTGTTEAEIKASAEKFKKLVPATGTGTTGGLPPAGGAGGNTSNSDKKAGREAGLAEARRRGWIKD